MERGLRSKMNVYDDYIGDNIKRYLEDEEKSTLKEKDRKELFEKYEDFERKVKSLKCIVQNPMEITIEMLQEQLNTTEKLREELIDLQNDLVDRCNNLK